MCASRKLIVRKSLFDAWTRQKRDEQRREFKRQRIHTFATYVLDPPISITKGSPHRLSVTEEISGEQRFIQFEDLLENGFQWKRHLFQKEFHRLAVQVLAEYIIGDDWHLVGPRLKQERNWSEQMETKMFLARASNHFERHKLSPP